MYANGPKIVTDGLVLCLDAGNPKSYSGSGTVWTDISRNGNNGALTNGPTFSSDNCGSIVFDGTDDYVNCGTVGTGGKITVNSWIKMSIGSTDKHIVDAYLNSWFLAITSANRPYFFNGQTSHTNGPVLSTSVWYMITGVQGSSLDLYVNGILADSVASNVNVAANNVWIGRWWRFGGRRPFAGNISQVSIYNRALSAPEVLKNYNASKSRYKL